MNLKDFEAKLKKEIEEKWKKREKIFLHSIEIKKQKIKAEYDKKLIKVKEEKERELKKIKDSQMTIRNREEIILFTQLLDEFSEEMFDEFLKILTKTEGEKILKEKIEQIKKQYEKIDKILIGKEININNYEKGDFSYGFKIILNNNEELDFSESYFNIVIKEKINEVINNEIFGNIKNK